MNEEFYQNCAIAAMQGILESGIKFAELAVKRTEINKALPQNKLPE